MKRFIIKATWLLALLVAVVATILLVGVIGGGAAAPRQAAGALYSIGFIVGFTSIALAVEKLLS